MLAVCIGSPYLCVTVQPLATSVAFAANPVADGVAEVPVIVTVLLLNDVVPLVPSSAASLTRILSTDAWLRAQDVKDTFPTVPPTRFKVDPKLKLAKRGVVLSKLTELPAVERAGSINSIEGRLSVVNALHELA